jgi:hypothetical protein
VDRDDSRSGAVRRRRGGDHLFTALWLSREIDHASRTYGSLGVAASLLGGLYLFGWLTVASAMLNASRWEKHLQARRDSRRS